MLIMCNEQNVKKSLDFVKGDSIYISIFYLITVE